MSKNELVTHVRNTLGAVIEPKIGATYKSIKHDIATSEYNIEINDESRVYEVLQRLSTGESNISSYQRKN